MTSRYANQLSRPHAVWMCRINGACAAKRSVVT